MAAPSHTVTYFLKETDLLDPESIAALKALAYEAVKELNMDVKDI